eukprot:9484787-Ditylum_brightwellii.AAC.1
MMTVVHRRLTEGGKQVLKEYEENIEYADYKAGEQFSDILENQMGVHAMHPGYAPGDWMKPGGMPEVGYRSGMEGMVENRNTQHKVDFPANFQ